ncbi:MAG: diguanylate cyclase [Halorhodospira sp.]
MQKIDPKTTYKRYRRWSISGALLINVVVAGMLVMMLHQQRIEAEEEAAKNTANMARLLMEKVSHVFSTADGSLRTIVDDIRASDFADDVPSERKQEIEDVLRLHMDSFPLIGNIGIVDASGQALYVAQGQAGFTVDDRKYYHFLRNHPNQDVALSGFIRLRDGSDLPAVLLARRIKGDATPLLGLGLMPIKLSFFNELIDELDLGRRAVAALYSPDLVLLARRPESSELEGEPLPGREKVLSIMGDREKGMINFVSPVDGLKRIFSFHRTPRLGLIAVAGMTEDEYLSNWRRTSTIYGMAFLAFSLLSATGVRQWLRSRKLQLDLLDGVLRESRQNESFRKITETMDQPLLVVNQSDHRVLHVNQSTSRTLGMATEDLLGHTFDEFLEDWTDTDALTELHRAETRVRRPDGSVFWAQISATPAYFQGEDAWVVSIIDINSRKAREEALSLKANYDALTGAYSRGYFTERLQAAFAHARKHQRQLAVLAMDLDHFKNINDTYGHAVGDAVLQGAVRAARQVLRESDIMGRIGGEEFALVCEVKDRSQAVEIAERIRQSIETSAVDIGTEAPIHVTASLGVAVLSSTDQGPEDLQGRADVALYSAKGAGRNQVGTAA